MKQNLASQSGLFNPRALLAFAFCSCGVLLGMFSFAATPPAASQRMPLAPAAAGSWSIVTSPNTSTSTTDYNILQGVACVSASDCWAVGFYYTDTNSQTLIERWDGTSWAIVNSPNTSTTDNDDLYSVTCVSASECWTVGYSNNLTSGLYQTLIEKWDGTSWTIVASPNTTSVTGAMQDDVLYGVTCAAASNCWAVGVAFDVTSGIYQTLTEQWNGSSWTVVTSANTLPVQDNQLLGVTCASPTECWAVGFSETSEPLVSTPRQTLIEQWNGTSWSIVASPNANTNSLNELFSVTCTSASDCWTIGWYYNVQGNAHPLVEQWTGTSWSIVTSPTAGFDFLYGVTCASASECWAVGQYFGSSANQTRIEQWDGTSWAIAPSPNTSATQKNELSGVACASATDCWAVGFYYDTNTGVAHTLTEHFTASPPIPTSVVSRKTHGAAGNFDIDLPLAGTPGIECRTGGATGDHTLVLTFPVPVTVSGNGTVKAQVTSGMGQVGSGGVANGNAVTVSGAVVTVPLTNVANAQRLGITIFGVSDGTISGDVFVPMNVLVGDTTADGSVNSADISQTKSQSGQVVSSSNFREDVTADGSINSADISLVKSKSGTALP